MLSCFILLSNGSQQNQCLVKQRDSWLTRGRNTGATAPMILFSRTLTLEAGCESAERFEMHLLEPLC